jgi:hypothetical protein
MAAPLSGADAFQDRTTEIVAGNLQTAAVYASQYAAFWSALAALTERVCELNVSSENRDFIDRRWGWWREHLIALAGCNRNTGAAGFRTGGDAEPIARTPEQQRNPAQGEYES